jgi:hypothetical protein
MPIVLSSRRVPVRIFVYILCDLWFEAWLAGIHARVWLRAPTAFQPPDQSSLHDFMRPALRVAGFQSQRLANG